MLSLNDSMRYLLYSEPTDMRKSFHTLSGLVIYSKLLEEGRFRLPSRDPEQGSVTMEWLDLVMMVEGVIDDPSTRLKRLKRVNF